jgi:hypothetical protein
MYLQLQTIKYPGSIRIRSHDGILMHSRSYRNKVNLTLLLYYTRYLKINGTITI